MINTIKGIVPPMITPLKANFELDINGVKRLIDHLVGGGVHGIFILGTTGESTSLSYKVRAQLILEAAKNIQGKIPLLVGITDTCLRESLTLADIALEAGAKAVVAAPPYYFNMGQEEVYEYYWDLADKLPLPLFLYNMPALTKIHIETRTVMRLAKHPNIVGLKDSSGNVVYFQSLLHFFKNNPDFILMVGPEEIMAETVLMGGHGGVNGGANIFPELYVALYRAAKNKDFARVENLQGQVMEVSASLYGLGSYSSSYIKGLKGALSVMGICENFLAPPFMPFSEEHINRISKTLRRLKNGIDENL